MAVLVEDHDGVRLCTLNRPERLNALDRHVYRELNEALESAAVDDDLAAVVLTGAGRAFCAGVDLAELGAGDAAFSEPASRAVALLDEFPKPLIMAVNGLAVGIGTTMLGYADLAFAGESARFKTPFTEMGVGPEVGSSWLLPHLLGWQRAAWLLLSSEWLSAQEALQAGLVLEVVPDDQLVERALAAGRIIASRKLASVLAVKRTMTAWRHDAVARALETENGEFRELLRTTFRQP